MKKFQGGKNLIITEKVQIMYKIKRETFISDLGVIILFILTSIGVKVLTLFEYF